MVEKIDYKREYKELYKPRKGKLVEVTVPSLQYIMIDGQGHPEKSSRFEEVMGALYGTAYTLKFMMKLGEQPFDFVVMPLESLWWADDWSAFKEKRHDEWKWSLMIMMPPKVTPALFEEAKANLLKKKGEVLHLDDLRFETLHEGTAAQMLHIGPYDQVSATAQAILTHIEDIGASPAGKYHEIYLSDPRRAAPEKLKTVVRMPFSQVK